MYTYASSIKALDKQMLNFIATVQVYNIPSFLFFCLICKHIHSNSTLIHIINWYTHGTRPQPHNTLRIKPTLHLQLHTNSVFVRQSLPKAFKLLSALDEDSDLEVEIPKSFDPFAEAQEWDARGAKEYVHIRIQQRNGKKSVTTVQGLKMKIEPDTGSYEKTLKSLKKELCCNGNIVQDKELGKIIQLQGDQRNNVSRYLVQLGLVRKEQIKVHGF